MMIVKGTIAVNTDSILKMDVDGSNISFYGVKYEVNFRWTGGGEKYSTRTSEEIKRGGEDANEAFIRILKHLERGAQVCYL